MSEVSVDLSPLALSALALLDERPMHPYELASTMRARHHDEFVRLNFGSLYHTVEVLERNGWIVPAEREKEGRRPERTIYRLTEAGRDVFRRVVGDIIASPRREYPHFAAGLMFMHRLEAPHAAELLEQRAQALHATSDKLSRLLSNLLEEGVRRLSLIELEHKIAMLEAEEKWVLGLAREVKTKKLQWSAGIEPGHERLRSGHGASTH